MGAKDRHWNVSGRCLPCKPDAGKQPSTTSLSGWQSLLTLTARPMLIQLSVTWALPVCSSTAKLVPQSSRRQQIWGFNGCTGWMLQKVSPLHDIRGHLPVYRLQGNSRGTHWILASILFLSKGITRSCSGMIVRRVCYHVINVNFSTIFSKAVTIL
jgi:hypothetical protein